MKISNPKDIRRIALALAKLEKTYEINISVVEKTISPDSPEKELIDCLNHYTSEKHAINTLKKAAFINLDQIATHEKAAS